MQGKFQNFSRSVKAKIKFPTFTQIAKSVGTLYIVKNWI